MYYIIFLLACISLHAVNTQHEKVIICGVGKNIASCLSNMIPKIEKLGNCFKDYRVIIYENNSTDNTAFQLKKWAGNNSKVFIISENLTPEQLEKRTVMHAIRDHAPNRMELIAYARNQVLDKALSQEFDDYSYLVMTDLDFTRGWDVSGVLSCFHLQKEWDCLTANGIDSSGSYYDRYAYRDDLAPLGPELLGEYFWQELSRSAFHVPENSNLQKIYSAFGGIAIYKKAALKNCRYAGYVTEEFSRFMEHIINKTLTKNNKQYITYKKILKLDESVLPVIFQSNSGYDGAVVCEHSILHTLMILHGFDKIFINPKMICRY